MKYVSFLRAINVGGNSIIKMVDLKSAFESAGYKNVTTNIQSGNVIFESDSESFKNIEENLEKVLSKKFQYNSKVVVLTENQFQQVLKEVPLNWKKEDGLRCYIAFLKTPATPQDIVREVKLTPNVDFLDEGEKVVYMTTLKRGLMKSGFTKLIGKKVYKNMTMRNYTTCQKIVQLMEEL